MWKPKRLERLEGIRGRNALHTIGESQRWCWISGTNAGWRDSTRNLVKKRGPSAQADREFPTRSDSSARPALTPQPRQPARGRKRATRTPAAPMAAPAVPHPLLGTFHYPPCPATHHPHYGSQAAASLRSSIVTWSSTAPPLHRIHVTSPSRPRQ